MEKPSSARTCNGDDECVFELNECEIQQLLEGIDDIIGPGTTEIETCINNNQNIHPQELSNTASAFLQDFEEFEKSCLPACGNGDASFDASIMQDFDVFEKTMLPPDHVRVSMSGDDDYVFELNECEIQQLLGSIDNINYNQNIHPQELSNTASAFVRDFEEFEKTCLPACGSGYASIDASIMQDFEVFEKTMLPPMDNVDDHVHVSINGGEGTEDYIKEMVNEMVDDGVDDDLFSIDIMEMMKEMADDENEPTTFIEEDEDIMLTFYFDDDDDDYNEYGFGGEGLDPFQVPQVGTPGAHYIKCLGETSYTKRKREKKKYKGILETQEQTAKRLGITKIRNREAAIRANDRRSEYESCLKSLLQKLNFKNKYLKNFIQFLECKKKDMQLQPLRRTRSGSI